MVARALLVLIVVALGITARADRPHAAAPSIAAGERAIDPDPSTASVYSCPMDPDVRSHNPGSCRRCGMSLVPGVPEPVEFHVDLATIPAAPAVGRQAVVEFSVHDPWKGRPVTEFNVVHERLFHAFVVSEDLEFFAHGHPAFVGGGRFQYPIRFPAPGMYRLLGDFYPQGASPQLTTHTVVVPGAAPPKATLVRDYAPKTSLNLRTELATIPDRPLATQRTQLRFHVDGRAPLQRYLGTWGHMLIASADLVELVHEHPIRFDGEREVDFDVTFPRSGVYRVWVQFQSDGVVNTAHFDVDVLAAPPL